MAHLYVIAGHGAGDCGAVGNGYTEAERVRVLASRIKALGGNNVTLGDMSRNYYADNGISKLSIPKDWCISELHMDSSVSASAKGAHVIIKGSYNPDSHDIELANFLCNMFPGRSNKIVGRNDLANPNRAAAKGFNYRLAEFGFISNKTDVSTFNSRMDEIAKGVLSAFGIGSASASEPVDGYVVNGGKSQNNKDEFGNVSYRVHMRGNGWGAWQCDGEMAGSTGQNRRIEAICLDGDGKADVTVHIKDTGDKEYKGVTKQTVCGIIGEGKRIEAIKIVGTDCYYMYRVHQKNIGWSEWANNGEFAGTKEKGLQLEAVEIKKAMFSVNAHVQNKGWIGERAAENVIGITGHALRLEAFKINPYGKEIKVKAHLQTDGWVDYGTITKDTIIGTVGESKRIECLCFSGDFDYRVHVQGSGWTDWTKADGVSTLGTVGQELRIEAIQFRER